MKLIIFIVLLSQASGSFFGALSSVGSSVGKLLSDVRHDIRDTYDCTVHVIERAIYSENEISEYYNKCKDTSEKYTPPSQESGNTFTVLIQSMNSDNLEANKEISKKLDIVEENLKSQVAYMSSQLDGELKNLSETVDRKLERLHVEEKELVMGKSLQEFENKVLLLEQNKTKENKEEIIKVFEDMMKMLTNYTAQQDSELKNEIKVIVAACENSSSKTILKELEKWKEKVMQQIKDTRNMQQSKKPFTVYSRDIPSNFKEVFAKLAKNSSDNQVLPKNKAAEELTTLSTLLINKQDQIKQTDKPLTLSIINPSVEYTTIKSSAESTALSPSEANLEQTSYQHKKSVEGTKFLLKQIEKSSNTSTESTSQPLKIDNGQSSKKSVVSTTLSTTSKAYNEQITYQLKSIALSSSKLREEQNRQLNEQESTTSLTLESNKQQTTDQQESIKTFITSETDKLQKTGQLAESTTALISKLDNQKPASWTELSTSKLTNQSTDHPVGQNSPTSESSNQQTTYQLAELTKSDATTPSGLKLDDFHKSDHSTVSTASPTSKSINQRSDQLSAPTILTTSESNNQQTTEQPIELRISPTSKLSNQSITDQPSASTISITSESNNQQTTEQPTKLRISPTSKLNNQNTTGQPFESTMSPTSESYKKEITDQPVELKISPSSQVNNKNTTVQPSKPIISSTSESNNQQTTEQPTGLRISPTSKLNNQNTAGQSSEPTMSSTSESYKQKIIEQSEELNISRTSNLNNQYTTDQPAESTASSTSESTYRQTTYPLAESKLHTEQSTDIFEESVSNSESYNVQTQFFPAESTTRSINKQIRNEISSSPNNNQTNNGYIETTSQSAANLYNEHNTQSAQSTKLSTIILNNKQEDQHAESTVLPAISIPKEIGKSEESMSRGNTEGVMWTSSMVPTILSVDDYDELLPIESIAGTKETEQLIDESIKSRLLLDDIFKDTDAATSLYDYLGENE